jgi:hypothetical protein
MSNFRAGPGRAEFGSGEKIPNYFRLKNLAHDVPLGKLDLAFLVRAQAGLDLGRTASIIYTTK